MLTGGRADRQKGKTVSTLFGKPRDEVIKHPGAFRAKADAAGEGTAEYAADVLSANSKASPETRRQAALAKSFATMRARKRRK